MTISLSIMSIPRVRSGDPISADHYNRLVDQMNDVLRLVRDLEHRLHSYQFDLGDLDEHVDPTDSNKTANYLYYASVAPGTDPWTDNTVDFGFITDPHAMPYLKNERHLFFFDGPSGKRIPIPGLVMQVGKLTASLSSGSSASCNLWEYNSVSDLWQETNPVMNVTAYDWLLSAGQSVASGKKVALWGHRNAKRLLVLAAEC